MNKPEFLLDSWNDINIEEYLELFEYTKNITNFFEKLLETIIFLTDDDSWEDEDYVYINEIYKQNKWILEEPNDILLDEVLDFKLYTFDKITLGEWIDIDGIINREEYHKLFGLFYRKYKYDEWSHLKYEPYQYNILDRYNELKHLSINNHFILIKNVIEYRNSVLDNYKILFQQIEDEELSEEEKEGLDESEINQIELSIKKENQKKEFAWQKLIDDLSDGNWSYSENILNLPVLYVFNMLAMKKVYSE